jgi:hypothetical protein
MTGWFNHVMGDNKKRVMSLQKIKKGGYGKKDEIEDILFTDSYKMEMIPGEQEDICHILN